MRTLRVLGPLALPLAFFASGLVIITLFRVALTIAHADRFADTPGYLWLFVVGLRMDVLTMSYLTILPACSMLLLPARVTGSTPFRLILSGLVAAAIGLVVYMEIATFPFIEEYDLRPDQKFLEYLHHVREVATTLLKVYYIELAIGAVALVTVVFGALRFSSRLLQAAADAWSWKKRVAAFPVVAVLLFLGARSSLGHKPANLSTACFSDNHLANELALNSTYSMLYAGYRMLRHEKNGAASDYGKMEPNEVFARVRSTLTFDTPEKTQDIPFRHMDDSPMDSGRPMNVVIFLQESMGASDVGCLEGPPITPNLCKLKDEGLWFSNLYATGTRTVRGIEATVSGFLPTSAMGVLKLPRARKNFFTAGSLFQAHGYGTSFIYGGNANFDEMRSFFMGNGFERIYDEPTFENPVFHGTWGVSDEDLVRKANEVYAGMGDKPFFSLILSTSNHLPYEFPDGRIELYEQPKQTHFNAIKYADHAIGLFFELAKKEKYFENTIFLIVADHNSHVRGNEHVPVGKFHIPGLIIGPNVPRRSMDILASQIDLLSTVLHFVGLDAEVPLVGRNLMELPPGTPGRAMMQYGSNNAYRVENEVIIQRPFMKPEQYVYDDRTDTMTPMPLEPELAKDALAYAHLPWLLYSGEDYRLPR